MKLFIDTANVEEIRKANDLGVICGVTTNPSLIAREGRVFKDVVTEITTIVDGPISAEVVSLEHEKMVEEALELAAIHKNIVIKIPMIEEGLKAVKILSAKGIKTNVTLIFSASQAPSRRKSRCDLCKPVRRQTQRYLLTRKRACRNDTQYV